MKILVINGSPKGKYSITLQTSKYLQVKFPEQEFDFLNVGQEIKKFEKDFSSAAEKLNKAELIIFSYPVYTFLAPAQLHKFIELMKLNNWDRDKYVTQISTSKHFYDTTAHRFIEENCYDMGLKYIKGLSADMDDLIKEKGQADAVQFMKYVLWSIENGMYDRRECTDEKFIPVKATVPDNNESVKNGDVVIITDMTDKDESLKLMVDRFRCVCAENTRIVNIRDLNIKGGCLGCFRCACDGNCVYKDNFAQTLRNNIQTADALIYAFSVKDHSMGPLFKMYEDRQFCNGHRTVTAGIPVGYLISGKYSAEMNLQTVIKGRSEVGGNFLAGTASDEKNTDDGIDKMAKKLSYAIDNHLTMPADFYGVGGMKIFRDLVFLMQGMMKADHKFYKKHKQYDFPQKNIGMLVGAYFIGAVMSSKKLKPYIGNRMNEGMLMPYRKVIEKAENNRK